MFRQSHKLSRLFLVLGATLLCAPATLLAQATVTTDQADYMPGQTVVITGTGWEPGETVELEIVPGCGCPVWVGSAVADAAGEIYNNGFVVEDIHAFVTFTLTATGLSSGLTATTTFTDAPLVVDFKQGANNDTTGAPCSCGSVPNCEHWIGSIVQASNSFYFEGMSNPQRVIFDNMDSLTTHTLTFSHQWTKGGIHAYDFLTGYYDAQNVVPSPPFTPPLTMNECGEDIGPPNDLDDTCCDLHDYSYSGGCDGCETTGDPGAGAFFFDLSIPDDGSPSIVDPTDGPLAPRICAYELATGVDRTIRIYSDAPIMMASLSYSLVGDPAGDSDLDYTLTWTTSSASTQAVIEMAGHLAVSGDPGSLGSCMSPEANDIAWGVGQGASQISGGPYHFNLFLLDDGSLGSQDNQIKGADVIITGACCLPDGSCVVTSEAACMAAGGTYQGDSTPCDPNPCLGACCVPCPNDPDCFPDPSNPDCGIFDCVDGVTEDECDALDPASIFHVGESCPTPGSCPALPCPCGDECPPDACTIECPPDVTVECDGSTDPMDTGMPTCMDTCIGDCVTEHSDSMMGTCPTVITRTWTCTCTSSGATSMCTQMITVDDTMPPEITCPAGFSVQCADDVPACDPLDASATDNCDLAVDIACVQGPLVGGACGGTVTNTYTATDDCGNTDVCTQTITVNDTTPPEITCPAGFSVQCEGDVPACDPLDASATDNCDLDVDIACVQGPLVGGACGGTVTNTYTATDDCGNTDVCTQTITVNDTTPPEITCPAGFSVQCEGDVPACDPLDASATDNCDLDVDIACVQGPLVGGACGGTVTNTYTATDDCGNTDVCTQTITVNDTTPPEITCPPDEMYMCTDCTPVGMATATDNCDDDVEITFEEDVMGVCPRVITRTWTATDDCGNTSTCVQTITCTPGSLVTDTSRCTFFHVNCDGDETTEDFRLIFTRETQNPGCFKLSASNPGQYYFNVFATGTPGDPASFDISIPYPFETQGANAVHAYSGVSFFMNEDGEICLTPENAFLATGEFNFAVDCPALAYPQPPHDFTVNTTFPDTGFVLVTVHLDYGLKSCGGVQKNAASDAVSCADTTTVLIPNGSAHSFEVSGAQNDTDVVYNCNAFKNNPGVAGLVLTSASGDPLPGGNVTLVKNSNGQQVGAATSDEDGFYQINYKHTGPPSPYTVTLDLSGNDPISVEVTLKGNGFAHVDFLIPGGASAETSVPNVCGTCTGDLDGNALVDGADVRVFTDCFVEGSMDGAGCACADMDGSGGFEIADCEEFVSRLLTAPNSGCP